MTVVRVNVVTKEVEQVDMPVVMPAVPIETQRAEWPPVTKLQITHAAVDLGYMSDAEADAWLETGALPSLALAAIAELPAAAQPVARRTFKGLQRLQRMEPLVEAFKFPGGLTDAQIDALFVEAMAR